LFTDRILPFDYQRGTPLCRSGRKGARRWKGFPTPDGYIAAIASSHDFAVASRDISAFTAAGLPVIDPWTAVAGTTHCSP